MSGDTKAAIVRQWRRTVSAWRLVIFLRRLRAYLRSVVNGRRCDHCGRPKHFNDAWHTFGNRDGKVWHGTCMSYLHWRAKAYERMIVLDLVAETYEINPRDVEVVAELRSDEFDTSLRNRAWRVFYDLQHHQRQSGGPR